jgi:hypothetical protein
LLPQRSGVTTIFSGAAVRFGEQARQHGRHQIGRGNWAKTAPASAGSITVATLPWSGLDDRLERRVGADDLELRAREAGGQHHRADIGQASIARGSRSAAVLTTRPPRLCPASTTGPPVSARSRGNAAREIAQPRA